MGRARKIIDSNPRDLYQTPQWCINVLAKVIRESLPLPSWIGDLGANDGRIGITVADSFGVANNFPSIWFNDLKLDKHLLSKQDDKHFFCDEANLFSVKPPKELINRRVIYASNPPFSLAESFIEWALRRIALAPEGSVAVFLFRRNWFGSLKRAHFINQHPPNRIITLAPRPSFDGCGTDACEYCWAFWFNGKMKSVFWPERIELKKGK